MYIRAIWWKIEAKLNPNETNNPGVVLWLVYYG